MKKKILVAEDEPELREVYEIFLTGWGYEAFPVSDGLVATELLDVEGVDLVITDRQMPKQSGVEVAKFAKSKYPTIKVLMVFSGVQDDEGRSIAAEAGADGFFPKPIRDWQQLRAKIAELIG